MIIVIIIVTVLTAGAALAAMASSGTAITTAAGVATTVGGVGGGIGGMITLGGAALTGGAGLIGVGAAMIGAAVGSIVGQLVGMAMGVQDKFSWKSVALSAITAGVGSGVGAATTSWGTGMGAQIGRAAISNTITQGVGVATGLQKKFDWRGVAAAATGAAVGGAVGRRYGPEAGRFAGSLAGSAVQNKGRLDRNAWANAAGSAIGGRIEDEYATPVKAQLEPWPVDDEAARTVKETSVGSDGQTGETGQTGEGGAPSERTMSARFNGAPEEELFPSSSIQRGGVDANERGMGGNPFALRNRLGLDADARGMSMGYGIYGAAGESGLFDLPNYEYSDNPVAWDGRERGGLAGGADRSRRTTGGGDRVVLRQLTPLKESQEREVALKKSIQYLQEDLAAEKLLLNGIAAAEQRDALHARAMSTNDEYHQNEMQRLMRRSPANNPGLGSQLLNGVQTVLDVVGLAPGLGEIADGVNALIYLGRGDYTSAGLSAAAMLPFFGWGATAAKAVNKAGKGVDLAKVAKRETAAKGPVVGGGATLEKLSASEVRRIQKAANKSGAEVSVVGSRVNPNKALHSGSDYDYVINANNKVRSDLKGSLPGAKNVREGQSSNLDIFKEPLDKSRPHVTFTPE